MAEKRGVSDLKVFREKKGFTGPLLNKTLLTLILVVIFALAVGWIAYKIVTAGTTPPTFDIQTQRSYDLLVQEVNDLDANELNVPVPMFVKDSEIIPYYIKDKPPKDKPDQCDSGRACLCMYSASSNIPVCKDLKKGVDFPEGKLIILKDNMNIYVSMGAGKKVCMTTKPVSQCPE
jgi:hypothetical protein